jgi:hypothetical protein
LAKFDCPNCGRGFDDPVQATHVESGCVLAALLGVISDRGESEIVPERVENLDSDQLWDVLGPLADEIEEEIKP